MICIICGHGARWRFSPDLDIRGIGSCDKHLEIVRMLYHILLSTGEEEYNKLLKSYRKEAKKMNPDTYDPIRLRIDEALKLLRAERDKKTGGKGGRELSEAITLLETSGMWVNRAAFIDKGDYSPLISK